MTDLRAYARDAARRAGADPETFVRQIQQESGFNPSAHNAGSNASGIAQIVPRWHPGVDVWDPLASLDYAARLLADGVQRYGSYRRSLVAYNWGSGNLLGYTKPNGQQVYPWNGERDTLPAETRHYLDVILGPGWPEPTGATTTMKLSEVLARGRSRIGDPYVWGGKVPGSFDCSGFVSWCYNGQVRSFTDWIFQDTERVDGKDIAPGDIVLWEYQDGQRARFPHVGLFLSDTMTLDARDGLGVGEHPQLERSRARRFYRRLSGVIVDTLGMPAPLPAPVPTPPVDGRVAELEARVADLERQLVDERNVRGYLTTEVAQAAQALADELKRHKAA